MGGRRNHRREVVAVTSLAVLLVGVVVGTVVSRSQQNMTDVFSLDVGDCVNGVAGTTQESQEFASTPVVPCSEPHEAEVITSFRLDAAEYPGEEQVVARSQARCTELMVAELPAPPRPGELLPFYFYPTAESWERADDRTVHCLAMAAGGHTTGSLLHP